MNNQEVFDTVVKHLRAQGKRSLNSDFVGPFNSMGCAYRGEEGTMCAAGCLIWDDEYQPWMEGRGMSLILRNDVSQHIGEVPTSLIDRLVAAKIVIDELQNIHDNSEPQYWEIRFQRLAEDMGLTYTPKETT